MDNLGIFPAPATHHPAPSTQYLSPNTYHPIPITRHLSSMSNVKTRPRVTLDPVLPRSRVTRKYKMNNRVPKRLLVEAVGDLPKEIVNRPKQGFTFPFDLWMRNELKGSIEDKLSGFSVFNKPCITKLIDGFYNHNVHWSRV